MKLFLTATVFLFSNLAFANGFVCVAQKSIMKYNSEIGKVEVRRATSAQFKVTSAEHEDPKVFDFTDESGKPWGSVQVTTGSHAAEKSVYANATVIKEGGAIIAFLLLKMPITATTSTASSLIFDELEEMPPSLTLTCTQNFQ